MKDPKEIGSQTHSQRSHYYTHVNSVYGAFPTISSIDLWGSLLFPEDQEVRSKPIRYV